MSDWLGVPRRKKRQQQQIDENRVPVVPFTPVRCPQCVAEGLDGRPVETRGQKGRMRYHRCKTCDLNFHSWETEV